MSALRGRGCLGLLEQRFGFVEGGFVADRCEQVSCFAEGLLGFGFAEGGEAAALAEEGVGVFGLVAELVPAVGGVGVEGGGLSVVAGGFGELGLAGGEGVVFRRLSTRRIAEMLPQLRAGPRARSAACAAG